MGHTVDNAEEGLSNHFLKMGVSLHMRPFKFKRPKKHSTNRKEVRFFTVQQTIGSILCCKCGIIMQPNTTLNMCINCLASQVDITQGMRKKQLTLVHCPECESYLKPPRTWVKAKWESKELLLICVDRLKSNKSVNLEDAAFVWTEPHSKRIKVKVNVRRKNFIQGGDLEQGYIAEFVQMDRICQSCCRIHANPDQWVAVVQLRQHVSHRKTFLYLEQLILKHNAALQAIRIMQMSEGIDFFFDSESHAFKFVEFVANVVPIKSRKDKQLVSHDRKTNNYNYKYTFSVKIVPICREDLICLPPEVSVSLGNLGPLVLCTNVSNNIILLDPLTLRRTFLNADQYWRAPFKPLLSCKQFVKFIVLSVESVSSEVNVGGSKYALADVEVARLSDFGKNNIIFTVKTHIGHLLNPGDQALGYDLYGANINDLEFGKHKRLDLPGVVLIKKKRNRRGKPRKWKLKSMNMEVEDLCKKLDKEKLDTEYEEFLKDLEENPELRFNISLYRNKAYQPSELASNTERVDVPIPLEELLADLGISDEE